MAALILAHTEKHSDDLATAVERALCSTQGILRATVEAAGPAATATERTAEVRTLQLLHFSLLSISGCLYRQHFVDRQLDACKCRAPVRTCSPSRSCSAALWW